MVLEVSLQGDAKPEIQTTQCWIDIKSEACRAFIVACQKKEFLRVCVFQQNKERELTIKSYRLDESTLRAEPSFCKNEGLK